MERRKSATATNYPVEDADATPLSAFAVPDVPQSAILPDSTDNDGLLSENHATPSTSGVHESSYARSTLKWIRKRAVRFVTRWMPDSMAKVESVESGDNRRRWQVYVDKVHRSTLATVRDRKFRTRAKWTLAIVLLLFVVRWLNVSPWQWATGSGTREWPLPWYCPAYDVSNTVGDQQFIRMSCYRELEEDELQRGWFLFSGRGRTWYNVSVRDLHDCMVLHSERVPCVSALHIGVPVRAQLVRLHRRMLTDVNDSSVYDVNQYAVQYMHDDDPTFAPHEHDTAQAFHFMLNPRAVQTNFPSLKEGAIEVEFESALGTPNTQRKVICPESIVVEYRMLNTLRERVMFSQTDAICVYLMMFEYNKFMIL